MNNETAITSWFLIDEICGKRRGDEKLCGVICCKTEYAEQAGVAPELICAEKLKAQAEG